MKIVKIFGGLGNQMFQYAFSLFLERENQQVKFDITQFSKYFGREFDLNVIFNLNLQDKYASYDEISKASDRRALLNLRIKFGKYILRNPNTLINSKHLVQSNFSLFYPAKLILGYDYFDGYWQNTNYLSSISNKISDSFTFPIPTNRNLDISIKMSNENSVGIHIRRLDKPKKLKDVLYFIKLFLIWRVCNLDYYIRSISLIKKKIDSPKFYIFTDDVAWVRNNFPLNDDFCIVDWNRGSESYWDMFLLSKCKHKIISMSSFSWWGAWLGAQDDAIIIAPKKWSLRFTKVYDLIPKEWIRI